MDGIRQYLLSVIAAAILCGIVTGLSGNRGSQTKIIKLLCGLFLGITVISPLAKIQLDDFSAYIGDISLDGQEVVDRGAQITLEALSKSIKSQTEAYILDKAISLGLELEVEVTLNEENPPLPDSVSLKGSVSPFAKEKLKTWIENDLGIPEDKQRWT